MRFALRFVSLLSLFLILTIGFVVNVPRAIYGAPKGNWLTWQSDSACGLPCWRGITPGKTTFKAAESILKSLPSISIIKFKLPDGSETWTGRFTLQTLGGTLQGMVSIGGLGYFDVQPVGQIQFVDSRGMSVASLIKQLGAPAYFLVPESRGGQMFNLYWSQGIGTEISRRNSINLLCDAGLDALQTNVITLQSKQALANVWKGYEGLRNELCTSTR